MEEKDREIAEWKRRWEQTSQQKEASETKSKQLMEELQKLRAQWDEEHREKQEWQVLIRSALNVM